MYPCRPRRQPLAGHTQRCGGDGDGWVACRELQPGDRLLCEDGSLITVEGVRDTGEWETVYNFRVADFHTYFVGCDEWGFSVWAHNNNGCTVKQVKAAAEGSGVKLSHKEAGKIWWELRKGTPEGRAAANELLAAKGISPDAVTSSTYAAWQEMFGVKLIYRKMADAEAVTTLATRQLQPSLPGKNGKKYLSDSLAKVQKFENDAVAAGTKEVVLEFRLDAARYEALVQSRVYQTAIKDTPGGRTRIEFHYEGLDPNGPFINIGIPKSQRRAFNDTIVDIRQLPGS